MRRWPLPAAVLAFAIVNGSAFADAPELVAHHGKIVETAEAGQTTQGFVEIDNPTGAADELTGASCPIAATTRIVDRNGAPVPNLAIAAGQHLILNAGGPHMVLQSPQFAVDAGGAIPCSLTFQNAGVILVYLYAVPAQ